VFVQGENFGPMVDCLGNKRRTLISSIRLFVYLAVNKMPVFVICTVSGSVKARQIMLLKVTVRWLTTHR